MVDLGFCVGAVVGLMALSLAIHGIRSRGPYSSQPGSVIYAIWVAEAIYGAGAREQWRLQEAAIYVFAGLVLWGVTLLAEKGRKAAS